MAEKSKTKIFSSTSYIFQVSFNMDYSKAVEVLQSETEKSRDKGAQYKAQKSFLQALLGDQLAFWVVVKLQHYELAKLVKDIVEAGNTLLNTNLSLDFEALKPVGKTVIDPSGNFKTV